MILLDVNVLIRAHRPDFPASSSVRQWLESALSDAEPIAVWDVLLVSAFRVLTHPILVRDANAANLAKKFLQEVRDASVVLREGECHWSTTINLIGESHARGNLVTDASIAALCLEHDCRLATYDRDFARFPKLQWFEPPSSEE